MKPAYYNEIDPYCVQWLRNLIDAGHLPDGDVDERSIKDVKPDDLKKYRQVHLFAGLGGFGLGLRMAGWPDDRPILTGGFPCQPWSVAGKQRGTEDDRDLWSEMARLIAAVRPRWVLGENVPGIVGEPLGLDRVLSDLECIGYTTGTASVPACAVDAPHRRSRIWVVGHASRTEEKRQSIQQLHILSQDGGESPVRRSCPVADAGRQRGERRPGEQRPGGTDSAERDEKGNDHKRSGPDGGGIRGGEDVGNASGARPQRRDQRKPAGENGQQGGRGPGRSSWSDHATVGGRRVKPGVCLLAHGIPQRVAKLRAFGNAVVPQVVAEVARAMMEAEQ